MPSARRRAATSAEEPAGNSTVISIGPFFGKGGSCASTEPVKVNSSKLASTARAPIARITDLRLVLRLILGENFRYFDPTPLACRHDASSNYRERCGCCFTAHFGLANAPDGSSELLKLLHQSVVLRARYLRGLVFSALQYPEALMHIVVCTRLLAVDVHQVVLRGRRIARVQRGKRAILVLKDHACHIGIVARQHQLR